ncbi:MAG TPA: hypothetical protein VNK52_17275 [Hyphomicrobiaceae bacterium]|nr:hypothetical protein [Hyphomicrobiaceae bacterium]
MAASAVGLYLSIWELAMTQSQMERTIFWTVLMLLLIMPWFVI